MNTIDDLIATLIYDHIKNSEDVAKPKEEDKTTSLFRKVNTFMTPDYEYTLSDPLTIKAAAKRLYKVFEDYPEFEDKGVIATVVGFNDGEVGSVETVKVISAYADDDNSDYYCSIETVFGRSYAYYDEEFVFQILLPKDMTPADRLRKLDANTALSEVVVSGETFEDCHTVNGGVLHIDKDGNVKVFDMEDVESFTI